MPVNKWKKAVLIGGASLIILLAIVTVFKLMQPQQGTPAPDFTLNDVRGETLSLSDFKGKVVVLDLMATWCAPCREEIKHLSALYEKYSINVAIITISVDPKFDTNETLKQLVGDNAIKWFVARDTANVNRDYGVSVIPTLVIIDKNGYIRARFEGLTTTSTLSKEIDNLLSEK
jgi:peroxiredoxin